LLNSGNLEAFKSFFGTGSSIILCDFINSLPSNSITEEILTKVANLKNQYCIENFKINKNISNNDQKEKYIILSKENEFESTAEGYDNNLNYLTVDDSIIEDYNVYTIVPFINYIEQFNSIVQRINDENKNLFINNPYTINKDVNCITDAQTGEEICDFGGGDKYPDLSGWYVYVTPYEFKFNKCYESTFSQPAEFQIKRVLGGSDIRNWLGCSFGNCSKWQCVEKTNSSGCDGCYDKGAGPTFAFGPYQENSNYKIAFNVYEKDDGFFTGSNDYVDSFLSLVAH
ncbi:hypothetical protein J7L48_10645, partial [bacterium]|nr:hypothetical protein [bacterium]